jgi:hypothetical protein
VIDDMRLSSGAGYGEFKKQIFQRCYSEIAQLAFQQVDNFYEFTTPSAIPGSA